MKEESEREYFTSVDIREYGTPTAIGVAELHNGRSKENELRPLWSNHLGAGAVTFTAGRFSTGRDELVRCVRTDRVGMKQRVVDGAFMCFGHCSCMRVQKRHVLAVKN